jgi:hypothetical protein
MFESCRAHIASVDPPANAELDAARRELQELYRELAAARPFSWSRMGTQRQIARVKRRIEQLERENTGSGA